MSQVLVSRGGVKILDLLESKSCATTNCSVDGLETNYEQGMWVCTYRDPYYLPFPWRLLFEVEVVSSYLASVEQMQSRAAAAAERARAERFP